MAEENAKLRLTLGAWMFLRACTWSVPGTKSVSFSPGYAVVDAALQLKVSLAAARGIPVEIDLCGGGKRRKMERGVEKNH